METREENSYVSEQKWGMPIALPRKEDTEVSPDLLVSDPSRLNPKNRFTDVI